MWFWDLLGNISGIVAIALFITWSLAMITRLPVRLRHNKINSERLSLSKKLYSEWLTGGLLWSEFDPRDKKTSFKVIFLHHISILDAKIPSDIYCESDIFSFNWAFSVKEAIEDAASVLGSWDPVETIKELSEKTNSYIVPVLIKDDGSEPGLITQKLKHKEIFSINSQINTLQGHIIEKLSK